MVPVTTNQVIFLWDDHPQMGCWMIRPNGHRLMRGVHHTRSQINRRHTFIELPTELWLFQEEVRSFSDFSIYLFVLYDKLISEKQGRRSFYAGKWQNKSNFVDPFSCKGACLCCSPSRYFENPAGKRKWKWARNEYPKELLEGTWWISTMEIHQAATDHPKISPKCPVLSYRMCLLIYIKIICRLLLFVVRFKHARSSHLAGMWKPIGFGFPFLRLDEFRMPWGRDVPKSQSNSWMTGATPIGNLHFLHHITCYWFAWMLRMDTNGPLA